MRSTETPSLSSSDFVDLRDYLDYPFYVKLRLLRRLVQKVKDSDLVLVNRFSEASYSLKQKTL